MLLDPTTIILMATLMGGAMSIVLFSAHRSFPVEIKGLGHWSGGLLLLVAAAIFYALRRDVLPLFIPTYIPVLCANTALLWAVGMSMIGTQKFYDARPSWFLFHAVWLVGIAGCAYWTIVRPDFPMRVAAFSFIVLAFYAVQITLIIRKGERHFSTWFFGLLMLFQALVVLSRGIFAILSSGASASQLNFAQLGPLQMLYLATGNFMTLLLSVAFMTVATRRLQTILELRSTQDPLTQVLNRRGFGEIYARERLLMRRSEGMMTLLSIDLDYFKSINDNYGHAIGDQVLTHVASVIGKALRETDYVARFGGEEFVALLPGTGLDRGRTVAERIQAVLRAAAAEASGAGALPAYTVSIGIACQLSADEELEGLLIRADRALYRAKEKGRNRIEFADPAPESPHEMRLAGS